MLTARRFIIYSITFSLRRFVTETNHWCTGKDSNLRTSLGGTDLQSVGFNHSPTCAETFGRCSRCAPSGRPRFASADPSHQTRRPPRSTSTTSSIQLSQNRETRVAHETTTKITARREKSEWSALEKPVAPLTESAV